MRVVMRGTDDVTEFSHISGAWVSADCEPVRIEFAWQRRERKPAISEADCHCSPELAARLIRSLFTGSEDTVSPAVLMPGFGCATRTFATI
jgi:hypothetical protein